MSTPHILSREEILGADDIRKELVDCPEWGGAIYVRGMTGAEREAYEMSFVAVRNGRATADIRAVRVRLAALTMCDEEMNPLFDLEDVEELSKKSGAPLVRIADVAQRLSGMEGNLVQEAEELGKVQNGASGTDLPSPSEDGQ